jgi:hypothetical protein
MNSDMYRRDDLSCDPQIVLAKGSEPVLLGFKRQTIMVSADASNDAIVVNVANAPGLPPVVGITLVTGDGDLSTLTIPEGFEVIEVCGCIKPVVVYSR